MSGGRTTWVSSMPVPLLTNWQVLKNYTQQGQMDGVLRRDSSQERDMPHPVRLGQGNGLFQGAAMEGGHRAGVDQMASGEMHYRKQSLLGPGPSWRVPQWPHRGTISPPQQTRCCCFFQLFVFAEDIF